MPILQMRTLAQRDPGWPTGLVRARLTQLGVTSATLSPQTQGKDILGQGRARPSPLQPASGLEDWPESHLPLHIASCCQEAKGRAHQ